MNSDYSERLLGSFCLWLIALSVANLSLLLSLISHSDTAAILLCGFVLLCTTIIGIAVTTALTLTVNGPMRTAIRNITRR